MWRGDPSPEPGGSDTEESFAPPRVFGTGSGGNEKSPIPPGRVGDPSPGERAERPGPYEHRGAGRGAFLWGLLDLISQGAEALCGQVYLFSCGFLPDDVIIRRINNYIWSSGLLWRFEFFGKRSGSGYLIVFGARWTELRQQNLESRVGNVEIRGPFHLVVRYTAIQEQQFYCAIIFTFSHICTVVIWASEGTRTAGARRHFLFGRSSIQSPKRISNPAHTISSTCLNPRVVRAPPHRYHPSQPSTQLESGPPHRGSSLPRTLLPPERDQTGIFPP